MSNIGNGVNTVYIDGEVKHITELDDLTLCNEWSKLIRERNKLYDINQKINTGWRGFILRLIGISLPDRQNIR